MPFCKIKDKWGANQRAIFHNAKRLIAKYGLPWVTLDDIARGYKEEESPMPEGHGRVSKALVRKLFINKENILKEISDSAWNPVIQEVEKIVTSNCDPTKKLWKLLTKIPNLLSEDLDACGVLVRERYPQSSKEGFLRGSMDALRCLAMLERLLFEIKQKGNLKKGVGDVPTIVHCLYGALEHGMLNIYLHFIDYSGDSYVKKIVDEHKRIENLIMTLKAMANGILKKPEK